MGVGLGGMPLTTITFTGAAVPVFPAASWAIALRKCWPFVARDESQITE